MSNNKLSLSQKVLPGAIALIILLIYYITSGNLGQFYPWLIQTVVVYASWFFLMRIIISTIVERHYDEVFTAPLIIGVVALIASVVLFGLTPEQVFVDLLTATVTWSLLYTVYGTVKEKWKP